MPLASQKINPCLWFDTEAEEAARFYCSVFKNSKVGSISRYGGEGKEIHGKDAGSVMAVEFELDGQRFAALNGARNSSSARRSRSRCIATARPKSTTSGTSSLTAARRDPAAG
jgi:predicted 3-demethylubiquinone-9 3-methyltransferase (glyoxalase superfamily)